MDKRAYRKRVVLNLLTRPLTMMPLVGGGSLLMAAWAMGQRGGTLQFVGVAALLAGAGQFLSSLFMGGGRAAERVLSSMQKEARDARESALDDLEERLKEDGDPRTERALADLRTLAEMFHKDSAWTEEVNAATGFDLVQGITSLFDTSVSYLEKTLVLGKTARRLQSAEVRHRIEEQREALVVEVQSSIEHLGGILASMEGLEANRDTPRELRRIREDLDQNLAVARRVEERMADWEAESGDLAAYVQS